MTKYILLAMAFLQSAPVWARSESRRITEYYTMVNYNLSRRDCRGEGNQIVRGRLYGSDCKPLRKYCAYGVGSRNNCLVPCRDAAGGRAYRYGQVVKIPPRRCQWGPYKGKIITQVRIVDVGGGVHDRSVDVFQGLCVKSVGGLCRKFAPEETIARYGGYPRQIRSVLSPEAQNMLAATGAVR